ncbi:MAG: methyltransferase domain-containing protein [Hyphomonadaceae bacterium]
MSPAMSSSPVPPSAASGAPPAIFDRRLHARRRARAARDLSGFDFLKTLACEDIALRLLPINRTFARALDLGSHGGVFERVLREQGASDRVGEVFALDLAPELAPPPLGVAGDEERLPFADASFDLVVSPLSLHWTNDLPGALIQIRRILKPDGLFVATLPGVGTLTELRQSLLAAEAETSGGAANRISPFIDTIDGARLLQRAGFAMPVSDVDAQTVRYADPLRLLADLKGMGETAAFTPDGRPSLSRTALFRAMEIYRERFSDPDGRVRATFNFVTLSGWAPAPDQPKPLKPGSARMRLADALGVPERSTGDAADPTGGRDRRERGETS